MAASLMKLRIIAIVAGMALFGTVVAEQLNDPTKPAIQLVPGLSGTEDGSTPVAPALGLQSVIISHNREAAIINGSSVKLGQKFGDAVLTEVNETCVVLMGPQGRQVMHMFPAVNVSKNETACTRKSRMQPLRKDSEQATIDKSAAANDKAAHQSRAKVEKSDETGMAAEEKDGSGK